MRLGMDPWPEKHSGPKGDGVSEVFLLSVITAAPLIFRGGNLVYGLTLNSALD